VFCSRSTVKLQTNLHRHNYAEPDPENKPVQTGTAVFIKELKSRHFPRFVPLNLVSTVDHTYLNLDYLLLQEMKLFLYAESVFVDLRLLGHDSVWFGVYTDLKRQV
jgi:hypothetical protein